MSVATRHLYEFGSFRLDAAGGILLREGRHVPVFPKALDTLVVLVENRGRVLTKEELLKQVWPDSFVEEATLAKNISNLRKVLGDTEENRFIETIPKRGYRFVAEVRVLEAVPPPASVVPLAPVFSEPVKTPTAVRSPWRHLPWAGLMLALAAAAFYLGRRPETPASTLKNVPLTSLLGRQDQVAFSPDRQQIAFVWDGPQRAGSQIYRKRIDEEPIRPLTTGPGIHSMPAWTTDGQAVVFFRVRGERRGWYRQPLAGGTERLITEVSSDFEPGPANSAYLSPDGRRMAIVDRPAPGEPLSIISVSLADGSRQRLTMPVPGTSGDRYPSFSPDGQRLAFLRVSGHVSGDLYVLTPATGELRRVTDDGLPVGGLAWTADSAAIVFSSRRGGSLHSLWRIPASGGVPQAVSPTAAEVTSPAISGERLAYTRVADDLNIWQITASGRTPLIASTFRDSDPDFSPDGRQVAFASGRSGNFGIWKCEADGSDARLLFDGGPHVTGSPRWSPDGKWIAFDTRVREGAARGSTFVAVMNANGGEFRALTPAEMGGRAPSWSRDVRHLYFASNRAGRSNIYKVPFEGGQAVPLTREGGVEVFESPDGTEIVYRQRREQPGLWRTASTGGGAEIPMPGTEGIGPWRAWRVGAKGIYFAMPVAGGAAIQVRDWSSGRVRETARLEHVPEAVLPSLAVSAAGDRILFAQYDQRGSNIMMVEGLR